MASWYVLKYMRPNMATVDVAIMAANLTYIGIGASLSEPGFPNTGCRQRF